MSKLKSVDGQIVLASNGLPIVVLGHDVDGREVLHVLLPEGARLRVMPTDSGLAIVSPIGEGRRLSMVLETERIEEPTVLIHDDDCGEDLDSTGLCPKCGFHPDMQSTSFKKESSR